MEKLLFLSSNRVRGLYNSCIFKTIPRIHHQCSSCYGKVIRFRNTISYWCLHMRMGDNMSMNLETGELHITSGWNDNAEEDDFWYILFFGNNLTNIENCKERTACTDTVASQAVLCWKRGVPVRAHLFFKGGALLRQIHLQASFHRIHGFLHTRLPV